nr:hypothetical protein [Providencia alcalifaciens]
MQLGQESNTGNWAATTGDEMNKKHESEFENVVKPLMKYMADNFHPHTKIIIDGTSAEVIEVISRTTTDQFIKD